MVEWKDTQMNSTNYTSVATNSTPVSAANKLPDNTDQYDKTDRPTFRTSWWSRRTCLEKGLLVLLALLLVVAVAMVTLAATRSHAAIPEDNGASGSTASEEICMTQNCVKTAARMLQAMDTTVDPCDDFFEYACGTWNREHIIPDDKSNYNTFGKLRDELQVALKIVLEEPLKDEDIQAVKFTKYLYQSCLNTSIIEARGDSPLHSLLAMFGNWPVLNATWDESSFDYIETMAELRLLNNRVLVNMWVSSDDKNSDVNIIQMDQSQLGMPSRDYFLKEREDNTLMAYQQFAINVAKMLGADSATAEAEMRNMVDFEVELANMTIPDEQRRDTEAIYHRYKLSELYDNITDKIDWLRYLNKVFNAVDMELTDSEDIVVYAPAYMTNLATLIDRTPKRILSNYMLWRIIMNRISNLPQRFIDLRREYNKALLGTDSERARWRTCVNYVNDHFGMSVGRLFVQKYFDEGAKANALEMIQNIRIAFNELLDEVPWMDPVTREVAREKAESIQEKIGYPDYIMNNTALDMDFEGISTDPYKYFENVLNNLHVVTKNSMKNLRHPVERTKWSTTPCIVNAFYSPTKNQIMFPAGILQPPFYHESYPKSLNFGGMAMVIGHEITHGFDDRGRQFDKNGNLKQWWSTSVIEKFKERAQCMIDQYGNYTVPEVNMNLNGMRTQGENIADNGGLKQAFRAYRRWVEERGAEEPSLPGLNLNHNQLFFLNFAQIWCGTARPESYLQAIRSGRHCPGKYRVIGSLSNSYDFATAFKCPIGSRMNPAKKCSVW